jgi:hypothetical protein
MTLDEIFEEISQMDLLGDNEIAHERADELLCRAIEQLGRPDIARAFRRVSKEMPFWYA